MTISLLLTACVFRRGGVPFFSCHAKCSEASQSLKEGTLRLLHSLRVTKREEEIATKGLRKDKLPGIATLTKDKSARSQWREKTQ